MGRYEGWRENRGVTVAGEDAAAYAAARGRTEDDVFSGNWIWVEEADEPDEPSDPAGIWREMVRIWLEDG